MNAKGLSIPPYVCDLISSYTAYMFKKAVLDLICPAKEYTFSGAVYEANRIGDI